MLCVNLFADRLLQPVKVRKTETNAELIVNLRFTLLTHFLNSHLKDSWLASEMCRLIILGEVYRHVQFVANFCADQPILEAGNEAV